MRSERRTDQMREVVMKRGFLDMAEGSVLMKIGETQVICTASVQERVPPFLAGSGKGWITAEYNMLPRATQERNNRERGKISGRTQEIQRLIGRSLRAVVDTASLGERTIILDCDVIKADGGTRTAAVTGAFVALMDALQYLYKRGTIDTIPIIDYCAAISVGMVEGQACLDLCYEEDVKADVDMNVVMSDRGAYIEIQGTGEGTTFTNEQLHGMLKLAHQGIMELITLQKQTLE